MDDMLTIAALYGPPDPQTRPNPYAAFQSVSGAQLTPQGPTTTQDPTGYGNNSPNFYTQQLANMNNAGPASFYQPIPPGSGAGVSGAGAKAGGPRECGIRAGGAGRGADDISGLAVGGGWV